jgi:hypothetical protein
MDLVGSRHHADTERGKTIIDSSVSTEIVFRGGSVTSYREEFATEGGQYWCGPVHYHTKENRGSGEYVGFMAGYKHTDSGKNHGPKLNLIEVPNYKICDFRDRDTARPDTSGGPFQRGQESSTYVETPIQQIEKTLGEYDRTGKRVFMPAQKERAKYLINYQDNDDEYSKLYLTKASDGSARGLFKVDFKRFLENNSTIFNFINKDKQISSVQEILQYSKILELKIYRDRVKYTGLERQAYRKYDKNRPHEEPSRLVGVVKDTERYKTPQYDIFSNGFDVTEVELSTPVESYNNRHFVFTDKEVAGYEDGKYQYRIEIDFVDGTRKFFNNMYNILEDVEVELNEYLKFSLSHYNVYRSIKRNNHLTGIDDEYRKAYYTPYYDNLTNSFNDRFVVDALNKFVSDKNKAEVREAIWYIAPATLGIANSFFNKKNNRAKTVATGNSSEIDMFSTMLDPVSGSPAGIESFIRTLAETKRTIKNILSLNKRETEKNSNILNKISKSTSLRIPTPNTSGHLRLRQNNHMVITDKYTFDSPSELFNPTGRDTTYIDYLTIGGNLDINFNGLRSVTSEHLKSRFILETYKFFNMENSTSDMYTTRKISETLPSFNIGQSAFSYLTPSQIKIKFNSVDPHHYEYEYNVFNPSSVSSYDNPAYDNFDPHFKDTALHKQIYCAMILKNHMKNSLFKNQSLSSEVSPASIDMSNTDSSRSFKKSIKEKAIYKRLFEHVSLTLHESAKHEEIFNKPSGPTKNIIKEDNKLTVKNIDDFHVSSHLHYYKLLTSNAPSYFKVPNPKNTLTTGLGSTHGIYNFSDLPNNVKAFYANTLLDSVTATSEERNLLNSSHRNNTLTISSPEGDLYAPYKFFNVNLTSTIEIYEGTAGHSKEDQWRLMTQEDIISFPRGKTFFCRIRFTSPGQLAGFSIPVVDRYFFINDTNLQTTRRPRLAKLSKNIKRTARSSTVNSLASKVASFGSKLHKELSNKVSRELARTVRPDDVRPASATDSRSVENTDLTQGPATSSPGTAVPTGRGTSAGMGSTSGGGGGGGGGGGY